MTQDAIRRQLLGTALLATPLLAFALAHDE